jgi:damage-control phosphatase, subfamily I
MNQTDTLPQVKLLLQCVICAVDSFNTMVKKGLIPEENQQPGMKEMLHFLATMDYTKTPLHMGQIQHRIIRKWANNLDPYLAEKQLYNSVMMAHYDELKREVDASDDPFELALRLAVAGNVIDFGSNHGLDIHETLDKVRTAPFVIYDIEPLRRDLQQAQTVLYLADNAGEIVLDKLFLETINHPNVWLAVRSNPVINDVTLADIAHLGLEAFARIIPNGSDAPGTLLEYVSSEFKAIFEQADLIIAKGQGNFEGLASVRAPLYFLLMAKCEHVAIHLRVNKGDFIVLKQYAVS